MASLKVSIVQLEMSGNPEEIQGALTVARSAMLGAQAPQRVEVLPASTVSPPPLPEEV